jgi:hypothetical protein
MMGQAYNPSTQEAEAEGPRVPIGHVLYRERSARASCSRETARSFQREVAVYPFCPPLLQRPLLVPCLTSLLAIHEATVPHQDLRLSRQHPVPLPPGLHPARPPPCVHKWGLYPKLPHAPARPREPLSFPHRPLGHTSPTRHCQICL